MRKQVEREKFLPVIMRSLEQQREREREFAKERCYLVEYKTQTINKSKWKKKNCLYRGKKCSSTWWCAMHTRLNATRRNNIANSPAHIYRVCVCVCGSFLLLFYLSVELIWTIETYRYILIYIYKRSREYFIIIMCVYTTCHRAAVKEWKKNECVRVRERQQHTHTHTIAQYNIRRRRRARVNNVTRLFECVGAAREGHDQTSVVPIADDFWK